MAPRGIIEDWKIITICYKWEGDTTVYSLKWDKKHNDKQLLIDFIKNCQSSR